MYQEDKEEAKDEATGVGRKDSRLIFLIKRVTNGPLQKNDSFNSGQQQFNFSNHSSVMNSSGFMQRN